MAVVFTGLFNISLEQAIVPNCLKSASVIPVQKQAVVRSLNHPVALTPIVMKCFIMSPLSWTITSLLTGGTGPRILFLWHSTLPCHICNSGTSMYTSCSLTTAPPFNIDPVKLAMKLKNVGLKTYLCYWIQDFLTNRPQTLHMGKYSSTSITLNTGAPQGCVLSPLLYS